MSLGFDLLFSILKYIGTTTVYDVSISEDDLLTAAAVAVKEARSTLDLIIYVRKSGSTFLYFKKRFGPIQIGYWNHIWTDSISEQDWNRIDHIKIMNIETSFVHTERPTVMDLFTRDNLQCKYLLFCTNYKSKAQESVACSILQRCIKDIKFEYVKIADDQMDSNQWIPIKDIQIEQNKMEKIETIQLIPRDEFEEMKYTFLDKDKNFSIHLLK
ncbi:hypothetical protein L596_030911 [Steinernema carpocapsae]|uniref:Uncharacterized protein n=1 Tax=Steinernema carpocapsae TaxID=34508 RepID=A0A4U5MHS7_STECR|nr:hypothetical protein L596_030911 [Steinernema carpocapsae]